MLFTGVAVSAASLVVLHVYTFLSSQCAVYQLKEGGNELGHGISPPPPSKGQQQVGTAESDKTL